MQAPESQPSPLRPGKATDRIRVTRDDGRIRVLVVDDHAVVRRAVADLLRPLSDLDVVGTAADGAEAVELASSLRPHLVLMDMAMPGIDGIEATRRILAIDPGIRVVMLSAFRARETEARAAGAVDHVLKDATAEELIRRLRWAADGGPRA